MLIHKRIKFGKIHIEAISMKLVNKNLIVLRGRKGFVMCGYLNLAAARKAGDAAIKITGVGTIEEAIRSRVFALSPAARKLNIYKGQPIKEVLKIIA